MSTKKACFLVLVAILLAVVACDLPTAERPTPTAEGPGPDQPREETKTYTPSPTLPPATATSTPPPTATHTPTSTPAPPMVSPIDDDVRCYFGPGDVYLVDGGLLAGEEVPVLGQDEWALWWQIENPRRAGKFCWVSAEKTQITGDIALAPVVPPPLNFVTNVTVDMSPDTADITCGTFPYTFNVGFTIEITGPCTVTLERSTSDGHTAPAESHTYTSGGTKSFSDYFRVGDVGTHSFRVSIISPNSMTGEDSSEMTCSAP
jgi:hypothetical protein